MRVVLFRIRNHSVYSNFLNTFTHKNNSTHQLVCVPCSAVNVTSMWAEKDCPLYWSHKHARTHARGREGGREADRWKAGRQTDRQEHCFRGIQSLGLFKVFYISTHGRNPPQLIWEAVILVS